MKNKKILIAVIALVAVVGLMLGVYFGTREKPVEGSKTITVTVVHGNGESKDFVYHTDEEFLGTVLVNEGLVPANYGEFGLYIEIVDGEKADWSVDEGWWALYEGDTQAATGADEVVIKDGDTFKLVYTRGYAG